MIQTFAAILLLVYLLIIACYHTNVVATWCRCADDARLAGNV